MRFERVGAQARAGSGSPQIRWISAAGALELLVGHHRRALEGQLAVDLDPGAAAVVLVPDPDRDRARDPVHPQQQHVQRMAALPLQALLGVVGGPDVERGELVDDAAVADREVVGDLGPGADPHPVGLRDAAVLDQGPRRRLLVGPDALLERPAQLGVVGLAHEVVALVVEGRIEEELLVLELEVLVLLADAALAQGDELLALGERTHRDGPFFEGNRHLGKRLDTTGCFGNQWGGGLRTWVGVGTDPRCRHPRGDLPNSQLSSSCYKRNRLSCKYP